MCARYQRRSDKQRIAEAFAVGNVDGLALELAPNYNVAPQTMQAVIIWDEHEGTRALQMMFWRFLPRYVTDPVQFKLSTINAKSETLLSNNVWRDSFVRRRCLVPVDNFIEWRKRRETSDTLEVRNEGRSAFRSGRCLAALALPFEGAVSGRASSMNRYSKPKGMHWRTFERLRRRFEYAARNADLLALAHFGIEL